jgi:hypothetical protein
MGGDDASRRYTDQQAREIFERALRVEADGRMGHEELVAAAAEVGLSRQVVERAVAELEQAEADRDATRAILARRRRRLYYHLVPFLAVNSFLFLVNWLATPGFWWCLFPLFCWGLLLFFHLWLGLSRRVSPRALRRELARSERQQRRTLRELLLREQRVGSGVRGDRLEDGAKRLGEAVGGGVATLLSRVAQGLERGQSPASRVRVEPVDARAESDREPSPAVGERKQSQS